MGRGVVGDAIRTVVNLSDGVFVAASFFKAQRLEYGCGTGFGRGCRVLLWHGRVLCDGIQPEGERVRLAPVVEGLGRLKVRRCGSECVGDDEAALAVVSDLCCIFSDDDLIAVVVDHFDMGRTGDGHDNRMGRGVVGDAVRTVVNLGDGVFKHPGVGQRIAGFKADRIIHDFWEHRDRISLDSRGDRFTRHGRAGSDSLELEGERAGLAPVSKLLFGLKINGNCSGDIFGRVVDILFGDVEVFDDDLALIVFCFHGSGDVYIEGRDDFLYLFGVQLFDDDIGAAVQFHEGVARGIGLDGSSEIFGLYAGFDVRLGSISLWEFAFRGLHGIGMQRDAGKGNARAFHGLEDTQTEIVLGMELEIILGVDPGFAFGNADEGLRVLAAGFGKIEICAAGKHLRAVGNDVDPVAVLNSYGRGIGIVRADGNGAAVRHGAAVGAGNRDGHVSVGRAVVEADAQVDCVRTILVDGSASRDVDVRDDDLVLGGSHGIEIVQELNKGIHTILNIVIEGPVGFRPV